MEMHCVFYVVETEIKILFREIQKTFISQSSNLFLRTQTSEHCSGPRNPDAKIWRTGPLALYVC
jgi:hypothetical protein